MTPSTESTDGSVDLSSIEASKQEVVKVASEENSNVGTIVDPAKTTMEESAVPCPIKKGMGNIILKAVEETSLIEAGSNVVIPPQLSQDTVDHPPIDEGSTIIYPDDQMVCDYEAAKQVLADYSKLPLTTDLKATYTNALLTTGVTPDIVEAMIESHPNPVFKKEEAIDPVVSVVKDRISEEILEPMVPPSITQVRTESVSSNTSTESIQESTLRMAATTVECNTPLTLEEVIAAAQESPKPTSKKALLEDENKSQNHLEREPATTPPIDATGSLSISALPKLDNREAIGTHGARQVAESVNTTTVDDELEEDTLKSDVVDTVAASSSRKDINDTAILAAQNENIHLDSSAEQDIFADIIKPRTVNEWLDQLEW